MERNYILFDTPARDLLYPFTYTRPVAACRGRDPDDPGKMGVLAGNRVSHFTVSYLQEKFPLRLGSADTVHVLINGHTLPDQALVDAIIALEPGQELYRENYLPGQAVPGNDLALPAEGRKEL